MKSDFSTTTIFYLLIISFASFAQKQKEEIRCEAIINEIKSQAVNKQNDIKIKNLIDEFDSLSVKVKDDNAWWRGKAKEMYGFYYYQKSELSQSENYYKEAFSYFNEINNEKEVARNHIVMALLKDKQREINVATEYFLKAIRILEKKNIKLSKKSNNKRSMLLVSAYSGIGDVFDKIKDFDKAIIYQKKAYSLRDSLPFHVAIGYYQTLASAYKSRYLKSKKITDLDSCSIVAKEGYKLSNDKGLVEQKGNFLGFLIFRDLVNKKYEFVLKQTDEELSIGRKYDEKLQMKAFDHKVEAYIGLRNYVEAEKWSDSLIKVSKKRKDSTYDEFYLNAIKQRHKIHKINNDINLALKYYEEQEILEGNLQLSEKTKIVNELETKYETEKKQKAIELLTAQNQVNEAQIKQKNYLIFAISALVLSLCGGFFFWFRQRKLKEKQSASDMKQRLLRAQLNPHFLFNCLNSIQRLYVDGKFIQANEFIADFAQLMRDILEKTGRTTIPLYEEMDFIEAYLSLEKRRLGDKFDYEIIMDEDVRNGDFEVPSFIVQPLAENALLHGVLPKNQKGKIEVIVDRLKDDSLSITVKDDGVGYYHSLNKAGKHTSKGMELIKSRLGKQGKMLIEELKNLNQEILGTKITLQIAP